MKQFSFKNFNITRVTSIIGMYDNINDKEKNIFKDDSNTPIKKFRKFMIEMILEPKVRKTAILNTPNLDIGETVQQLNNNDYYADVVPFIKNDNIYYMLRDKSNIKVSKLYINFDEYYSWCEAKDYINAMIKNNNNKDSEYPINVVYEDNAYFRNQFYLGKIFNYRDDII